MRKMSVTQTDNATWAPDSTIATDIERVGLITRIDVTVEVTPSATLSGANQTDGLWRLIQNLRIVGGAHTYFNLPADDGAHGGTLLHYMNVHDGHGVGHEEGGVTAPSAAYVPVNFVYHCGTRPRDMYGRDNPFDLTAFLPATQESQLRAEWIVSGNDVMDDTVTISSAVAQFTLHRLLGTEAELKAEMARQAIVLPSGPGITGMVPSWAVLNHANGAAAADFSEEVDVQLGAFLKRIALLSQDATGDRPVRAGDQLTEIALKMPETNERLIQVNVEHLTGHMGIGTILAENGGIATTDAPNGDFGGHAAQGIYFLDLRAYAESPVGRDYGLDLRRLQTGALKLGFTIDNYAAGDDTLIIFERYQPWKGNLANR